MAYDYEKSIRPGKLPHIWCPGCGHGIVMKGLIRAMDACELDLKNTAVVSGIGCASRLPGYLDACTLHTAHGRAAAFATGVKMAKPEMTVLVVGGDGDGTAIGGNHFIHACRRNIDITYIVMNNSIYGMTGGQFSPCTPTGAMASTTPYGNPDPTFDISKLAIGAGATFVARGTAFHATQIDKLIAEGIRHKGTAVIEILDDCPTTYGRRNKFRSVVDMMKRLKDIAVPVAAAAKMTPEQLEGKVLTGVLFKEERPEYTEQYTQVIAKAQGA
ncbi:2-oxoacid:ferredoxin oxidoreductase subunit beta [Geothermobacter hydrogeniphilus]|uniref:2-oxoacid:ferredoxin oxidoreductase subunit beta n=1 Tax=Geothermobacter hydrogeniphilus TaxID=1969733 RepID=A0A1X0XW39_9BACT|nr:2-oxoacid:ferredoxin oxidoreductase subunit beta [Geothermobacter hydrogeniphilus]ORJ57102.1 2-oxoacid:ferredoxin oxidoreductase subunit beta [Geothermobacter hydrogeniphilus]